jgi:hypothetical protein
MSKCQIIILILVNGCAAVITAQDSTTRKLTLDGYVSFMESAMDANMPDNKLLWESVLHNRLNLNYFPSNRWSFSLQVRNRLIIGDRIKMDDGKVYKNSLAKDMGVVDMSWNPLTANSVIFNTAADRLFVKYALNNLEITVGRQRINWGQTYVWNPNDWFNNYSFFDVDYVERPGSDAVRIQYFTGALSSLESVVKFDSACNLTIAGLFKMNVKEFDLQFLGGILAQEDLALGFGWAGGLGQIGFRGEMSYLHPTTNMNDTTGLFFFSMAFDYTFANSLMIQAEGFYNQLPRGSGRKSFTEFYARPLSVKDLSFTELNFFAQVSYPFTPLFSGSLAGLYFPDVKGYYLGPALTWSLSNNLDFSLFLQYFSGRFQNESGVNKKENFTLGFGRVKYNF